MKVGDKVVCIEGAISGIGESVIEGDIYVVLEVGHKKESSFAYAYDYILVVSRGTYWKVERFRKVDESFAADVLEMINKQIEQEYLILK